MVPGPHEEQLFGKMNIFKIDRQVRRKTFLGNLNRNWTLFVAYKHPASL